MKYVVIEQTDTTATVRVFDGKTVRDKVIDLSSLKSQEINESDFIENSINNASEKDWLSVDTSSEEVDLTDIGVAVAPPIFDKVGG